MPVLTVIVLGTTAAVVAALFTVMWRERKSSHEALVAVVSGGVLAAWAATVAVLAYRGALRPLEESFPPVGIVLVLALVTMAVCLSLSPSLRSLLTRQVNLIRLNLWRLLGLVFLILMALGQVPALWAVPAGIGDILVGAAAPWIARHLDTPQARRRAIVFNVLGLTDLAVAVGLGIMASPGPTQVLHTTPTTAVMTQFPMALVPTFLVPLAVMLHVVSLWQLLGAAWVRPPVEVERRTAPRGVTSPSYR